MKTPARVTGAIITLFVMIAVTLWGAHAWKTNHYAVDAPDATDRARVLRDHGGEPVDGDYLSGIHYTPHPGTVIIFGSRDGGTDSDRARRLQNQGYDVLSLYYFGQPGQQPTLSTIPLDFFDEALSWVDTHQLTPRPPHRPRLV